MECLNVINIVFFNHYLNLINIHVIFMHRGSSCLFTYRVIKHSLAFVNPLDISHLGKTKKLLWLREFM